MSVASPFSLKSIKVDIPISEPQWLGNGGFLFGPTLAGDIFTREQLGEEQLEIGKSAKNFMENKVRPLEEKINHKKVDDNGTPVVITLVKEAGALGFLGIDVPEEYGGLEMDFVSTVYLIEELGVSGSFSATALAHKGIGTLPILYFGTPQQKAQYLPKIASGEWISCYALTEANSGSDALSGKTTAVLAGDHYILSGSKQFITNGAWANVGIVFANIDGQYSALIVELEQPGVIRGAEEKKMGIKGSSTTSLTFENVKVPKENLLGNVGDAATIAFNILNVGRLDMGIATVGGAKSVLRRCLSYGKDRKQFGRSIIDFDMQTARVADIAARIFAVDSMVYRIAHAVDEEIKVLEKGPDYYQQLVKVIRSFAMETSIAKVEGSEMLFHACADAIKLFGGYGYIEEYGVEEGMRDCFINMIFEGTNDINRLVIFDFLVRNIYAQGVPFHRFMDEIHRALRSRAFEYPGDKDVLVGPKARLYAAKYLTVYLVQELLLRFGKDIKNNQQGMKNISDMIIQLYSLDTALSRTHYLVKSGNKYADLAQDISRLLAARMLDSVCQSAWEIVNEIADGQNKEALRDNISWLCSLTRGEDNVFALRREITRALLDDGRLFSL